MKAILDTNFIISVIKNKIRLFEDLEELYEVSEIVVPVEVLTELEKIMQSKDTTREEKEAARLAEFMIKKKNLTMTPLGTPDVDAGLIRYCVQEHCIVATLDRELKEKIKKKAPASKFLTIKGKNRIGLE